MSELALGGLAAMALILLLLTGILPPGTFALALAGFVTLVWPTRAALAAAGVTGLAGLVLLREAGLDGLIAAESRVAVISIEALASAVALGMAMARFGRRTRA